MKELYDLDSEKVNSFVQEFFGDEQKFKQTWAQQARTWVAFANGDQNPYPYAAPIVVNNNPSNYSTQTDQRQNMYQGDELESIVRTLVSYMTRQEPTVNAEPIDEDQESKNIARVSKRVLDAKYKIDGEKMLSEKAATDVLTYGTIFGKDYWDYAAGAYRMSTDEMGNPELDDMDNPLYTRAGNNASCILNPLTVSVDHSVIDFSRQPIIIESYVIDTAWAKEAYDRNEPGYTGQAGRIREDSISASTVRINEEMKFAIPYVTWGTAYRTKGQSICQEVHIAPSKTFPRARQLVIIGGVVCYDSAKTPENASPYFIEQEETIWHPYTCMKYEEFIGRFLGKSLIEGLIPLQMRLNEINGAILENANTLAKPNIHTFVGQLKKGVTNGRGANIYASNWTPGMPPPFVLQGAPLPAQFFKEREEIIDTMVRKAGTNMAMQGNPPPGVTAAAAIQTLLENANSQQSALMQGFTRFLEQRFTKKLRFIHKFMSYPDPVLGRYLKHLNKDFLNNQVGDFVGCRDLSNGITVSIDVASMIPKSHAAQTQVYMELAKSGGLGPAVSEDSPRGEKVRAQLMEKLDLEPLETEEAIELKKAKWENEKIMKGEPVSVNEFDNDAIHLPCHIEKFQDPVFQENSTPEQQQAQYAHIKAHQQKVQQAQMAAQAPMGLPAPIGAPPPQGAGPIHPPIHAPGHSPAPIGAGPIPIPPAAPSPIGGPAGSIGIH